MGAATHDDVTRVATRPHCSVRNFPGASKFLRLKICLIDMPVIYGTTQHWLERAREAREMAAHMRDPEAKRSMLAIADGYEKVAKRAEAREAGVDLPNHHPNNL
jgi:hypothetical protein